MVSFVPMIGVNIAVTSLAGRFYGANNIRAVYRSAHSGLKIACCYCAILVLPFLFFTDFLVNMFLAETTGNLLQIREMALFMVKLITVYLFCDAVLQVFGGALRGVGDTFWSMVVSVIIHWSFALIVFAALKLLQLDAKTTWVIVIGVFMFFGPVYYLRFRSGKWKKNNTTKEV
jgi:MATE family multidrug resistance protein